MAADLGNTSMEALLTEFTELVKNSVKDQFPQQYKLEGMATILEEVTEELKTYCSDWKAATQQAEDGAKQMTERNEELEEARQKVAQKNKELEEGKKQMTEENEKLEETKKQIAKKNEELEERRKQIEKEEEHLSKRTSELEAKEKLFEDRRIALDKKEKLLQQQSADLKQTELTSKNEQARLQDEAAVIEYNKSKVDQALSSLDVKTEAAQKANVRRTNELRRREELLKHTHQSALALNEMANESLAAAKKEHNEDKKLRAILVNKYNMMRKLRSEFLQMLDSWSTNSKNVRTSKEELVNFEVGHREILAGLREEIESLSTALEKQTKEARGISKDIELAGNDFGRLLTSTECQLGGISTKIGNVTKIGTGLDELSAKVTSGLDEVSSKIDNITKVGTGLDEVSAKIGNVTQVTSGLDEVSAKIQGFQPTAIDTLRELTEAVSKAHADASKAQADSVKHSDSRFKENLAKRRLGPTSPEKPVSKRPRHARHSSVGSADMLTNLERLDPLPENILDTVRSPRGQGRVTRVVYPRREDDSSPLRQRPAGTSGTASTPSGGHGALGSSIGSQNALHSQPSSSMDLATATGERSSQGAMISSSQSGVSAGDIPALSDASDEVKRIWAHIDFPANWDVETSKMLLQGFNRNISRKTQPRYRPAGLLDSSATHPICLRRKLAKVKPTLDNGDGKCCSDCKTRMIQCVCVSFVAEDLANVEYNPHSQEKRWKLSIRED